MTTTTQHPDKYCSQCGKPIYLGQNGCDWYSTCYTCKPIRYPKPSEVKPLNSMEAADYWEGQILARQERYDA